jgi:hypothetical protein
LFKFLFERTLGKADKINFQQTFKNGGVRAVLDVFFKTYSKVRKTSFFNWGGRLATKILGIFTKEMFFVALTSIFKYLFM